MARAVAADRDFGGDCIRLSPLSVDDLQMLAEWAMPDYGPEQCDRLARPVAIDSGGLPLLRGAAPRGG